MPVVAQERGFFGRPIEGSKVELKPGQNITVYNRRFDFSPERAVVVVAEKPERPGEIQFARFDYDGGLSWNRVLHGRTRGPLEVESDGENPLLNNDTWKRRTTGNDWVNLLEGTLTLRRGLHRVTVGWEDA